MPLQSNKACPGVSGYCQCALRKCHCYLHRNMRRHTKSTHIFIVLPKPFPPAPLSPCYSSTIAVYSNPHKARPGFWIYPCPLPGLPVKRDKLVSRNYLNSASIIFQAGDISAVKVSSSSKKGRYRPTKVLSMTMSCRCFRGRCPGARGR